MREMKDSLFYNRGFTIIELLIVIVVIGILATITIIAYNGIQGRASDAVVQVDLENISKKLELWKVDNSGYPDPGVPSNNLQAVGLKVSKNNYAVSPKTDSNLIYCYDFVNRTRTYAILALSKSGKAFYVTAKQSNVQAFPNAWAASAAEVGDMCTALGDGMDNSYRGYASTDSPTWRAWAGVN